jgi:N-acylneuraminate cytidylyltransferase/CMP-N,N'-diacetyllegionaminic acid synthase
MIAIIPARGGSKGLPDKNSKLLHGKPLLSYTIEAALQSLSVSRVIVSTDSLEIATIAKKYGAEVPFLRPDFLAQDDTKAIDVYDYTIDRLMTEEHIKIDEFMVLLPTAPLRNAIDIDGAYQLFTEKNADSVISYTEELHPIHWHKFVNEEGKFEAIFTDNMLQNRQKLKKSFYPNGAIYIFKTAVIKKGLYYTENSLAYIMPNNRSVDIDTIDDFEYAEFLIHKSNG